MAGLGILGLISMAIGMAGYTLLGSLWAMLIAGVGLGMIATSWAIIAKEDKTNEEKLGIPTWMKETY